MNISSLFVFLFFNLASVPAAPASNSRTSAMQNVGCYFKMTLRKLLRTIVVLLLLFAVIVGMTSTKHPIIIKWLAGSARIVGRPIKATVYTDGKVNKEIKVYHIDKYWKCQPADYYILHFLYVDKSRLKFLSLNKKDNYVGGPSSTNVQDYDIIAGLLFQSEVGSYFTPMQDDMKGFNFNPKLSFTEHQITFTIPPTAKELKCDSLRVTL